MSAESSSEIIKRWVDKTKQAQSPLERWTATSVEEIYLSKDFAYARIRGPHNPDTRYTPHAVRIVAIESDDIKAVSIALLWDASSSPYKLGSQLREEIAKLPYTGIQDRATLEYAKVDVKNDQRQVLAALELSQTLQRERMVQVLYPKTYIRGLNNVMSLLGMRLNDTDLRTASFGLAVKFLQSVPFTNEKPVVLPRIDDPSSH